MAEDGGGLAQGQRGTAAVGTTTEQPALVSSLLRPEAYPHPVGELQLLETHLSWVILTGPYAYKLKKPVAFGFVDFSTPAKRDQACREELRLNQRLSPERYLDLVAVAGPAESARIVVGLDAATEPAVGTPLTLAVRMLQFEQQQLLPAVLARGELGEEAIRSFAEALAQFHSDAAQAPAATGWGTSEAVIQPVRDNLTALAKAADTAADSGAPIDTAQLERLNHWVRVQGAALTPWFEGRRNQGQIRECHGDLHLGNMLLGPQGIEVFDALEFSETLRWIDPISELAFLVMDLAVRGRPDLGSELLNRWIESTGDADGLRGWAWYSAYRALVRAKVNGLRLGQAGLSPQERQQCRTDLQGYLDLAERWTQPRPLGLVLMHGLSGSGKSTVAARLGQQLGAMVFRSDVERKRLFGLWGIRPTRQLEGDLYGADASRFLYQQALPSLVESALAGGLPVILDACFLRQGERRHMADLATRLGVPLQIVACSAPEASLRQRLLQRTAEGRDPSDATVEVMEQQLGWLEPLTPAEEAICHRVDAVTDSFATAIAAGFRP